MGNVVLLILMWPVLALVIGLFRTWYCNYADLFDWWYQEIDKNPESGIWYYGSRGAAKRRERC